MAASKYSLGVDFGSNSVRALIVDLATGEELGTGVDGYAGGESGVFTSKADAHIARQSPEAYLDSLKKAVKAALAAASKRKGFKADAIIGIGVDTTGSTPIPVAKDMTPLSSLPQFKGNLNAYAWMWKDHSSMEEAAKITAAAAKLRPEYLKKCGGTYSSEWLFSKIWHCLNVDRKVFDAAYSWVEFCDFIPAVLCGIKRPEDVRRGVCAAGHKAMYCAGWGGLPDAKFLGSLDKRLAALLPRLYSKAEASDKQAGTLSKDWAAKFGLKPGIPVAVGAFDAHFGAVGAGVGKGSLVKIIGTSTCDIMVAPNSTKLPDIPGVCGIVDGSVIPGFYGIEAGQSAVGDIFNWFITKVCEDDHKKFLRLTAEASALAPGESGLVALDWNNGNRCVLVDPKLSGLLIGQTLHTSQAEIYRALIEATAFGARKIIDRLAENGVKIDQIICCGGIAEKSPLFMQIYADVLGRKMKIAGSGQACALGSAIFGAVVAGPKAGGFANVAAAQKKLCSFKDAVYKPQRKAAAAYDELYAIYSELHDSFGVKGKSFDHSSVMKRLLAISAKAKRG